MGLTRAEVDPDALRHNCGVMRGHAGNRKLFAVVKCDGYGHGMLDVCDAIGDLVDGFCVFEPGDGLAIRKRGFGHDVLVMGPVLSESGFSEAAKSGLWMCVGSAQSISVAAGGKGARRLFVKCDTGMHRLGIPVDEVRDAVSAISGSCESVALMHHFANADARGGTAAQAEVMADLSSSLGLPFTASNSAATLWANDAGEEFVRCGISVYGCTPGTHNGDSAGSIGLLPAMTLTSQVVAVQAVREGEGVGYGSRWRAPRDTRVAVIACGYGHGYPRPAPDGTPVWVNGKVYPLVGRVSMEMLTVECTEGDLREGDRAELWGANVPVDEVSGLAGTIGYTLVAGLPSKVRVNL